MQNQPDPFQAIHTGERIYPEQFWLQVRDGMFYMAFKSGEKSKVFVSNLVFAKRLGRSLLRQIEQVEKASGVEIPGNLSDEPVISPIQTSDKKKEK